MQFRFHRLSSFFFWPFSAALFCRPTHSVTLICKMSMDFACLRLKIQSIGDFGRLRRLFNLNPVRTTTAKSGRTVLKCLRTASTAPSVISGKLLVILPVSHLLWTLKGKRNSFSGDTTIKKDNNSLLSRLPFHPVIIWLKISMDSVSMYFWMMRMRIMALRLA